MKVKFDCLSEDLRPFKKHPTDTGLDLFCATTMCIPPHSCRLMPTGVRMELDVGYWGLITSRSSSYKQGIQVNNGIIDNSYRGEMKVQIVNITDAPITVEKGTRVAQLIFFPLVIPLVEYTHDLNDTSRGNGGFGSTGK